MSARPFDELRPTGLLWLINTTVFHPRGYALALHFDDVGACTGWSLLGDGSEAWQFADQRVGEAQPGYMTIDECFAAATATLTAAPIENGADPT